MKRQSREHERDDGQHIEHPDRSLRRPTFGGAEAGPDEHARKAHEHQLHHTCIIPHPEARPLTSRGPPRKRWLRIGAEAAE